MQGTGTSAAALGAGHCPAPRGPPGVPAPVSRRDARHGRVSRRRTRHWPASRDVMPGKLVRHSRVRLGVMQGAGMSVAGAPGVGRSPAPRCQRSSPTAPGRAAALGTGHVRCIRCRASRDLIRMAVSLVAEMTKFFFARRRNSVGPAVERMTKLLSLVACRSNVVGVVSSGAEFEALCFGLSVWSKTHDFFSAPCNSPQPHRPKVEYSTCGVGHPQQSSVTCGSLRPK